MIVTCCTLYSMSVIDANRLTPEILADAHDAYVRRTEGLERAGAYGPAIAGQLSEMDDVRVALTEFLAVQDDAEEPQLQAVEAFVVGQLGV